MSADRGQANQGTYIRFWRTQLELDDANLSLFHPCWSSSSYYNVLVEHDPINKLGVLDCPSYFFDDPDIPKVDIRRIIGYESSHSRNGDRCQRG